MQKLLFQIGEFGLIDLIKDKAFCTSGVVKGIGDDAAVVKFTPNRRVLMTTDMLIEGVHFTLSMPPKAIGYKAICCSISDIAAMGGVPKHAVVSLGVSSKIKAGFISRIYQGMNKASKKFGVSIVGGDTIKSNELIINVALTGEANRKDIVYRNGARQGDQIFVTGKLGNSFNSGWHLKFMPRVNESQYLVKNFRITSMIDVSDGLIADLGHILQESKVGAFLYEKNIPLKKDAGLKNAYYDGEDFELLFTASPKEAKKILTQNKYRFYCLGEIVEKSRGFMLINAKGNKRKVRQQGYVHF